MTDFPMSQYASKADRAAAINAEIDLLAKKRDYSADVLGKPALAWSYQVNINKLVKLLSRKSAGLAGESKHG